MEAETDVEQTTCASQLAQQPSGYSDVLYVTTNSLIWTNRARELEVK